MYKKTPYHAYYFSEVKEVTPGSMKKAESLPEIDISRTAGRMSEHNIFGTIEWDESYHRKLQEVITPPYAIYYQWNLSLLDRSLLAIVWPRKLSHHGESVLSLLFENLQHYNLVTISGMADGADMICHSLSLKYDLPTIIVLGWWFAHFLVSRQKVFMESVIAAGWLIISEYKHEFVPTHRSFPQRNRLIAWLADVVFLPEAEQQSWSLITVEFAHKQRKPIYAPMHDMFHSFASWTNAAIASWIVTPLADLFSRIGKHFSPHHMWAWSTHSNDVWDHGIVKALAACWWEGDIECIMREMNLSFHDALTTISIAEAEWVIEESSPWRYRKKSLH